MPSWPSVNDLKIQKCRDAAQGAKHQLGMPGGCPLKISGQTTTTWTARTPHAEEEAGHDPEELLTKYECQQAEIQELRDRLKDILGEALTSHED
ncbi:MAG: hypothetical protein KGY41_11215 [Desulfovermiculus sp.]|nr:hypothetical protein [Desulfovermiculus sp.]